jgi:hypothetical protein
MTDARMRAFGRERGRNVCAPTRGAVARVALGPALHVLRGRRRAGAELRGWRNR